MHFKFFVFVFYFSLNTVLQALQAAESCSFLTGIEIKQSILTDGSPPLCQALWWTKHVKSTIQWQYTYL